MQKFGRYGQVALFILILGLLAGGLAPQAQTQSSCLGGSEKNFVAGVLTSIKQFELVGRGDISLASFPIGRDFVTGAIEAKPITVSLKNLRAKDFEALERDGVAMKTRQAVVSPPSTYQGYVNGEPGQSVVALYVTPEFVSGFLWDASGWFFIEPARPLLKPMTSPFNPNSSFQGVNVDNCIALGSLTHIIYEAKHTESLINLDPTFASRSNLASANFFQGDAGLHEADRETAAIQGRGGSAEHGGVANSSAQTALNPIEVTLVADQAFYDFYQNVIQEKLWWEAEEEVLNAVDALYAAQFPGLSFAERALEAWRAGGPGVAAAAVKKASGFPHINAYELLCEFAQSYPAPPAPVGLGWPHNHSAGDTLVHLFSGQDLGPLPAASGVSDGGDGVCQMNCATAGTDVIGLAEGLGGFKNNASGSCLQAMGQLAPFKPQAHHALSQQTPKLTPREAQNLAPPAPDTTSAWKYQATLFQRTLLMAHEFGHVLAARHDPSSTASPPCTQIMCPMLNPFIGLKFSTPSWNAINSCLQGGPC